ncbi:uncharacterized protein LOC144919530 [Branchiostoma floridae x Branchiostoma belcheri]
MYLRMTGSTVWAVVLIAMLNAPVRSTSAKPDVNLGSNTEQTSTMDLTTSAELSTTQMATTEETTAASESVATTDQTRTSAYTETTEPATTSMVVTSPDFTTLLTTTGAYSPTPG